MSKVKTKKEKKDKASDEGEKLVLFKVAEEQLQTRIYNSTGDNIGKLIEATFDRLDIEVLMSKFIKRKKEEVKDFLKYANSIDPLEKIKARGMLKKNRELEIWSYSDGVGYTLELKKLCEEFKRGRIR